MNKHCGFDFLVKKSKESNLSNLIEAVLAFFFLANKWLQVICFFIMSYLPVLYCL